MTVELQEMAQDDFCYLTTIGRNSGNPHTIEIWFVLQGPTLYMLAGSREKADWVKNIRQEADVSIRIRNQEYTGVGRVVKKRDEDALVRKLVVEKYQPRDSNDLSEWGRTALPVAVALQDVSPM